jgi:hypothetical protein
MPKQRMIVATFEEDGSVHIEGFHFTGKACNAAMAPYEQALGITGEKVAKPEMRQVSKERDRATA